MDAADVGPTVRAWLVLAAAVLLALPAAASAWLPVGETESSTYYMDRDTVRVAGAQRRVWRLFEYKQKHPDGVQSGKALIEIHCQNRTYRYLRTMYYSEGMGQGKYVGGTGPHRREHIGPGTMVGQLADTVCAAPAGK
jgi:hypothetical protein